MKSLYPAFAPYRSDEIVQTPSALLVADEPNKKSQTQSCLFVGTKSATLSLKSAGHPPPARIPPRRHADSEEVMTKWPLNRLQAETAAKLDALLPSILDRAFKGEL